MTEEELILKYPKREFGRVNVEREIAYWISGDFDDNIVKAEKFYRDFAGKALEYCRNNP